MAAGGRLKIAQAGQQAENEPDCIDWLSGFYGQEWWRCKFIPRPAFTAQVMRASHLLPCFLSNYRRRQLTHTDCRKTGGCVKSKCCLFPTVCTQSNNKDASLSYRCMQPSRGLWGSGIGIAQLWDYHLPASQCPATDLSAPDLLLRTFQSKATVLGSIKYCTLIQVTHHENMMPTLLSDEWWFVVLVLIKVKLFYCIGEVVKVHL